MTSSKVTFHMNHKTRREKCPHVDRFLYDHIPLTRIVITCPEGFLTS
jgi:hypothetical protein